MLNWLVNYMHMQLIYKKNSTLLVQYGWPWVTLDKWPKTDRQKTNCRDLLSLNLGELGISGNLKLKSILVHTCHLIRNSWGCISHLLWLEYWSGIQPLKRAVILHWKASGIIHMHSTELKLSQDWKAFPANIPWDYLEGHSELRLLDSIKVDINRWITFRSDSAMSVSMATLMSPT